MPLPSSQPVPTSFRIDEQPTPRPPAVSEFRDDDQKLAAIREKLPEPRWMYATLTADGTTTITIGSSVVTLPPAGDLDSGRRQMIAELRKAAAQLDGKRVWVEITDPDGVWPTEVPADGPLLALDKGPAGRGLIPVPDLPPRLGSESWTPSPPQQSRIPDLPSTPPAPARREATPPPRQQTAAVPPPVPGPTTDPGSPPATEVSTPPRPSFDDLLAARPDPYAAPAAEGFRGALRQLSGGRFRPAPGKAELAHRDRIRRIQKDLDGPRIIVVVNPKGGAHKSTAALLLAQKFGTLRGGGVAFYDNNEARATAAWRAMPATHDRTVEDLLTRLHDLDQSAITGVSDLGQYMRSQGPAGFDLLAAAEPENPLQPKHIPASDVDNVLDTLGRFYRVIIVDTGNSMHAPNWGAAVLRADQLVIVSTVREDTALSAGWLAQALQRAGRGELLAQAVTVLSAPATTQGDLLAQFRGHFSQLTRAVCTAPFDPALDLGQPINYPGLSDATHKAWEHTAAEVADGL
jgi:MinD-like ATPase involved in chromosome partitioning or flagellar assembly